MAFRKFSIGLGVASVFVIGIWILGMAPQVMAETLNFRGFTHATKAEVVPIPDVEGHAVSLILREGVIIFENGELAWSKTVLYSDLIKRAGPMESYIIMNFQDGSTIIIRRKGMQEATSAGVPTATKHTGEIIHGTGRFQGIKGTYAHSGKMLPPEKGEWTGKALMDGTLVYTLPSK